MNNRNLNKKITNNTHILFLGAGASAPLGLKPTGPFLELIPKKLNTLINDNYKKEYKADGVLEFMTKFYKQSSKHYNVTLPDSEIILDYFNYLIEACSSLDKLPGEFWQIANAAVAFNKCTDMFKNLQHYIQKIIVEHYSRVNGQEAENIYKPLLKQLCATGQLLPIFTTNYDWVLECLAEECEAEIYLEDGFEKGSLGERWTRKVFDRYELKQNRINLVLFKLHGSTSWYKDLNEPYHIRKFPNPSPELAGSRAVLIYPTQVKSQMTKDEPFNTAYEYFLESLSRTKLCIIIGFSFRDPAINEIIRSSLNVNSKLKLIIVDPKIMIESEDEGGDVKLIDILEKIGLDEKKWKERLIVIKGKYGENKSVSDEIIDIVNDSDNWDIRNHFIEL